MARSPVGSNDGSNAGASEGSITSVAERILLWASRPGRGFCRAEYVSEPARQQVLERLKSGLPSSRGFAEIELVPVSPDQVARDLVEQLRSTSAQVVSVHGFPVAYPMDSAALENALAPLNFLRDILASIEVRQIWWMPPGFAEVFVRAVPDLDSFFLNRVCLTESARLELGAWLFPQILPFRPRSEVEADRARLTAAFPLEGMPLSSIAMMDDLLHEHLMDRLIVEATEAGHIAGLEQSLRVELQRGLDSVPEALVSSRLAILLAALGRLDEAEPFFLRALAVLSELRGPVHPDAAILRIDLAYLAILQGRWIEARQKLERAKTILDHFPPEEFPQLDGIRDRWSELNKNLTERESQRVSRL